MNTHCLVGCRDLLLNVRLSNKRRIPKDGDYLYHQTDPVSGVGRPRTHVPWCFTALVIKLSCHSAWPFHEMYCTSSIFSLQMFLQWLMSFYELIYILFCDNSVCVILFYPFYDKSILAINTWKKNTNKRLLWNYSYRYWWKRISCEVRSIKLHSILQLTLFCFVF